MSTNVVFCPSDVCRTGKGSVGDSCNPIFSALIVKKYMRETITNFPATIFMLVIIFPSFTLSTLLHSVILREKNILRINKHSCVRPMFTWDNSIISYFPFVSFIAKLSLKFQSISIQIQAALALFSLITATHRAGKTSNTAIKDVKCLN